jgi:hypothetical protein
MTDKVEAEHQAEDDAADQAALEREVGVEVEHFYPALYHAADDSALDAEHGFLRLTRIRLCAAVLAAVFAASAIWSWSDTAFHIVAAVLFLLALGVEVWLLQDRPEANWYDARALAESTKTLAWRYAVCGYPFPRAMHRRDADKEFAGRVAGLLEDAPDIDFGAAAGPSVTEKMKELRAMPLAVRGERYLRDRIGDQQRWYAKRAESHHARGQAWRVVLIIAEVLGFAGAFANVVTHYKFDGSSIVSALIGASVAWLAVKQHDTTSRAYVFASHELACAATRLQTVEGEAEWAIEVANAERAISREHTMWRAARVVLLSEARSLAEEYNANANAAKDDPATH